VYIDDNKENEMSTIFGTAERLIVSDTVDSDLHVEISMAIYASDSESVSDWLNEDEAKRLVEKLTRIFEL
jgi:hypothetical protein